MQLIVQEVAKNIGTGSLKDACDPWEGPSRSEDDDGELAGPSLQLVPAGERVTSYPEKDYLLPHYLFLEYALPE